ncbi:HET-domain-containing protein [Aspergillus pseudoustus]|uniref:HET-domain-containing protein n=1 Tax=Aspergillus pseudoustus TaxID=1810923 RepID=A0ABR4JL53_9EURO
MDRYTRTAIQRAVLGGPTTTPESEPESEKIFDGLFTAIAVSSVIGFGVLAWGTYKLYGQRNKPIELVASAYHAWEESRFRPPYTPLQREDEIRLLVLEPGKGDDPIQCRLRHAILSEKPEYEALSYVWGDPAKIDYVTCDGVRVRVRESIFGAFQALRRPDSERVLWVDVLCINQPDSVEKGKQVELMGDIYASSQQVLVWLGRSTRETQNAFSTLAKAHAYLKESSWIYRAHPYSFGVLQAWGWMRLSRAQWAELDQYDWVSILTLLQHPWPRRVWTMQELVKAPKATIVHGTETIPADVFFFPILTVIASIYEEQLAVHIRKSKADLKFIHSFGWRGLESLGTIKDNYLLNLVVRHGAANGAGDPRDRIYGYRSIASDCDKSDWEVVPDYAAPVAEVYTRFARWCLLNRKQMQALSYAGPSEDSDRSSSSIGSLPSWVPDWSSMSRSRLPRTLAAIGADYNASAGSAPDLMWLANEPGVLRIRGRVVDSVERMAVSYTDFHMHYILSRKVDGRLSKLIWSKGFRQYMKKTLKMSQDDLDRVSLAQTVIERYGLSNAPDHLLPDIAWMENCKAVAFSGSSQVTPARLEAFWRTMARNRTWNGDAKVSRDFQPALAWYVSLLEQVRDGKKQNIGILPKSIAAGYDDRVLGTEVAHLEPLGNSEVERLNLLDRYWAGIWSQHFCRTEQNRLGWVPEPAQRGDLICIFDGAQVPYVIRQRIREQSEGPSLWSLGYWRRWVTDIFAVRQEDQSSPEYILIGECYIHGIMEGEVMKNQDLRSKYFALG